MAQPNRTALRAWIVPVLIVVIGTLPWVQHYLLAPDAAHWMVDLNVYREAGVSLRLDRAVYDHLTDPPQNLPFTYPPFAALLSWPLSFVSFTALGWVWFYAELLAVVALVRLAAAPLLGRLVGWRRELGWGVGALALAYTLPVADGLRFGQVNAFLVLACLIDVARPDLLRRVRLPQGVLVGLAAAIKLTPAVFVVYFLVTRQWRAAVASIAAGAVATLGAFAVSPSLSVTFWTDALFDSNRLGANDGTANQSLRGALLRLAPEGVFGTGLWLLAVVAVVVVGYLAARRAHARQDLVLAFALVGTVSVLVSPVSWSHHFHWLLPGLCWLLCAAAARRSRGMVALTAGLWLVLTLHLTWWAHWRLVSTLEFDRDRSTGNPFWMLLHNSYCLAAVVMLGVLAWCARRPDAAGSSPSSTDHDPATARRPAVRNDHGSRRSASPTER